MVAAEGIERAATFLDMSASYACSIPRGRGLVQPPQSHVSRTVIEEHGVEQHIFRHNIPFGTAAEHGTMFIGFSCEQHRLARMFDRMAGAEDGIRDALTRYTTTVGGAYYFVPSAEALCRFASPDAPDAPDAPNA